MFAGYPNPNGGQQLYCITHANQRAWTLGVTRGALPPGIGHMDDAARRRQERTEAAALLRRREPVSVALERNALFTNIDELGALREW